MGLRALGLPRGTSDGLTDSLRCCRLWLLGSARTRLRTRGALTTSSFGSAEWLCVGGWLSHQALLSPASGLGCTRSNRKTGQHAEHRVSRAMSSTPRTGEPRSRVSDTTMAPSGHEAPPSPAHAQPRSSAGASAAQIRCEMSPRRGFQGGERTWGHTEQMAAGRSWAGLSSAPAGTRHQGKEVVERLTEHLPCQPPRRHHLLGTHGGWGATNTTLPISQRKTEAQRGGACPRPKQCEKELGPQRLCPALPFTPLSPQAPASGRPSPAPPSPQPSVNHQRCR